MAKNIKLRDLLSEQDPRIAGYKTPKDRYFMSPDAALNKLTKDIEKAAGKDATAVKPAISPLAKSPFDRTREDELEDIADVVYDANGYIYDDESKALTALKDIKNLEEWTYLETYFEQEYGKKLYVYINYFLDNRTTSKQFESWLRLQSWMPADVKQRYIDAVNYAEWDPTKGVFGLGGLGTAMYANLGQPEVSIDVVHDILQGAAIITDFVPVVGWVVSSGIELLDSGIYLAQGDPEMAGYMAMFAALPMIPSAVTSLAKAGAKLTKTQLTALSDKVYKMLKSGKTAAAFTKAEIAALKAMQNVAFQTEITKAFVKDLVKKLANKTNATKFVKQLKAASQSVQKKLISTVTRFADDVDGKMFTDILIQNGFMSAGASAIRLANAVTDAEMKSMQQEVLKNLNNYFTKQAEKIQGPFKGAAWLESRNRDMMLTSLLEQDIEAEPIRPTILPKDTAATSMDTIDTSVTEPATIKTVKPASKPKTAKKSTTSNKTYSDNTADYEAENVKGLGDGEWSVSDILYWYGIGWGAFKIGGLALGAIQGANVLALWLNGKGAKQGYLGFDKLRSLDVYQAFLMISDRKALKNEGIILTRKEYRAITKDIQRNAEREIDYVLSQIRNNKKFIAKSASQTDINAAASEAYKQLYRLTPGSTKLRDYAVQIAKAVEQQTRKSASRTSTASKQSSIEKVRSAIAKSSVTPGSTTAASINLPTGAPAGTVLTVNQRVALQNDPSTPWSKLKNL